jgi:endoglucanase
VCVCFNSILHAQTPVSKNGALHVQGGNILNHDNKEPQLRGLSFSWSLWAGRKYYNPAVTNWIVNDFKVNIVRVAMGVQPKHGYLD